ncbi:MAG TPA: MBL fold metallo-hydrolase [Methanospirillum sp.]|nr:MBL fold metallo-hydrolase [Methanospirillum sp.]
MEITLLGTGDAVGTPHVGCQCPQCTYAKEQGIERLRTSILITHNGHTILIDTTPDLRRQLLDNGSPKIDAVIWTHGHYDHFMGYGEFYRVQKPPSVYAAPPVLDYCGPIFDFLIREKHAIPTYTSFTLFGIEFCLVEVTHPNIYTCGVVFTNGRVRVGYTSDTNEHLPQQTRSLLMNLDLLLIDGLFPSAFKKVTKHLNYEEAVEIAGELKAEQFRVVHMSHYLSFTLPHQGRDRERFEF